MKSKALTILLLSIVAIGYQSCDTKLNVENPDDFYKYIGKDGNQWGVDLATNTAGDIFILGKTDSHSDGMQIYMVMTDAKGNVQWTNTFGDPGDEEPKDIELLSDGNLVVVADRTEIGTGQQDFMIYKVNSADGSIIGTPLKVGDPLLADHVNSITQTPDDGFVVASYADSSAFKVSRVHRFNNQFQIDPFWTVKYSQGKNNGVGLDLVPVKVVQADPTTFYTFGYTNSDDGDGLADYNFFVLMTNETNVSRSGLLFLSGADASSDERLTSVGTITLQNGTDFILTGYTSDATSGQQNLFAVRAGFSKANEASTFRKGNPKTVTTALSIIAASNASVFPSANGFLLLGEERTGENGNIYLTKLDNFLDDAWPGSHTAQLFGGVGNDHPGAVVETSNQRILVLGTMVVGEVNGQSKIVLMNLSPNGMFGE